MKAYRERGKSVLDKNQKIVITVGIGLVALPLLVCLYGFTVGGAWLSFRYIAYCLVASAVLTIPAFLLVCGVCGSAFAVSAVECGVRHGQEP